MRSMHPFPQAYLTVVSDTDHAAYLHMTAFCGDQTLLIAAAFMPCCMVRIWTLHMVKSTYASCWLVNAR